MHNKILYCVIFFLLYFDCSNAQTSLFSGKLIDKDTKKPIELATITFPENALWAVSDKNGYFQIKNVPKASFQITFSSLGYVKKQVTYNFRDDIVNQIIEMQQDNLKVEGVVVTAKKSTGGIDNSYIIDRNALNHIQIQNVMDISQLLPGGKTSNATSLLGATRFALRGETGEEGYATFGTAVEVDGVRLTNNATPLSIEGIDTRNIGTSNIESVEVITGVPSVEYGDLQTGIVKINTRRGKTPLNAESFSTPNTKQIAVNKGFSVGKNKGIINAGFEHTVSVEDIASPYTTYKRNNLSVIYSNALMKKTGRPLFLTANISGNIGGYNSKRDPDAFLKTFSKRKDNTMRCSFDVNWLLRKSWITNVFMSASFTQSNELSSIKTNKSSSTSSTSIHGKQEGYFVSTRYEDNPNAHVIIVPPGYWYQTRYEDNKPFNFSSKIKADFIKGIGMITNKIKVGMEYTMSKNNGKGVYYNDLRVAPDWREYSYNQIPTLHNVAWYAEEQAKILLSRGTLIFNGGIRSDNSYVDDSEYGWVRSYSPRMNMKFATAENESKFIRQISFHAGLGKTVKLPSFAVLYPKPGYLDILTFVAPTSAGNTYFSAYYTKPTKRIYNPNLRWQSNTQVEIGMDIKTKIADISLSAYYNKTTNPYESYYLYTPFKYKMTDQTGLDEISIPIENRIYNVDQFSGIVTVKDKTGKLPDEVARYRDRTRAISSRCYINGTSLKRAGLEWVVDFKKIKYLNTSLRLDGNLYYYKGLDGITKQSTSSSAQLMPNGEFYKYIGFYSGGTSVSNGKMTKSTNLNLTIITRIPALRLVISLRIESSLYSYSRNLSEIKGKRRGFVLDNKDDYFPSTTKTDIYAGNQYVGLYPDYYVSFDDMKTKIPFEEKFRWAKENDTELFNNLARLVKKSNYNFTFNPSHVSAYYSANINITKEIGNVASISFYAKNFLNNMSIVKDSQNEYEQTLYNSGKIPPFYYGLTLRLKL